MEMKEHKSFAGAAKAFFGLLPGESLNEFMTEIKSLSETDRQEITQEWEEKHGIKIL